jgi:hypothetical protein
VVWFVDEATVVPGAPGVPGFHHGGGEVREFALELSTGGSCSR